METLSLNAPGRAHLSAEVVRWLAGLDTAVVAAALAVSWFSFSAWLRGEYWWAPLNVAGALFYGDRAFQLGVGRATLAGGAVLLLLYSFLGTLLARAVPSPLSFTRVLLIALLGAVLWHLAAGRLIWALLHPFAPRYFPAPAAWSAHLLFALALTRLPRRSRALAAALGPPAPLEPPLWPPLLPPAGASPGGAASALTGEQPEGDC
jgi:hypothetical protein